MKTKFYLILILSIIFASCSSLQQSTVNDDIYYSPKDDVFADNGTYANTNYDKSKSTVFGNEYDEKISEILEDESKEEIDTVIYENDETGNPYYDILVRDRDEAYQKRLDGFSNPYYGMNSFSVYYSDAYWYASAYDPYFYNIVIMGDQVWVEPSWMTSSFGYWPHNRYCGYGYYSPYYSNSYGHYSPYYYGYNNWYYSPYYSPYYSSYYGYSYPYHNNNYASSAFYTYRRRSIVTGGSSRMAVGRTNNRLPETYMGRDVRSGSTVMSGVNRQSGRVVRTRDNTSSTAARTRTGENVRTRNVSSENATATTRIANARRGTSSSVSSSRNYTRPESTSRSTYSTSKRATTRYNRPASSNVSSDRTSRTTGASTYSPNRGSSSTRSGSGSSYTPNRSTRSSGSSSVRSSSPRSSSGSSGSVRSSGSSSRSSGSSSGSSGSSSRSSGSKRR